MRGGLVCETLLVSAKPRRVCAQESYSRSVVRGSVHHSDAEYLLAIFTSLIGTIPFTSISLPLQRW